MGFPFLAFCAIDIPCDDYGFFACDRYYELKLILRGLCFKQEAETWFKATYSSKGALLQGLYGYQIQRSESITIWFLLDIKYNKTEDCSYSLSQNFPPGPLGSSNTHISVLGQYLQEII